jgi:hypothetical protein
MSSTDDPSDTPHEHHHSLIERLRGTGVGMEDPNIIGDAGPTDVAPGADPPLAPLTEELPPEEETPSERMLPSDSEDSETSVEAWETGDVTNAAENLVEVSEVDDGPAAEVID